MATVFVVFPPGAGGNHLRNIIVSCYKETDTSKLYSKQKTTVHSTMGSNLQDDQISNAVQHQDQMHVLHGHFGEIMSFQQQVRNIVDKKFVIISPDTVKDRRLLNNRRRALGYVNDIDGDYFDGEQVFLYEPFMYHWYFQVPMDHITNISVSEWFTKDIDSVLNKLSYALRVSINKEQINYMHTNWIEANNL